MKFPNPARIFSPFSETFWQESASNAQKIIPNTIT
jgi:hypothetical protein